MTDNKDKIIPTRNIDFQVDTIQVFKGAAGTFYPGQNNIIINYIKGEETVQDYPIDDGILIHEQQHRDNNKINKYRYAVSPEQAYKLNMHNEISANIAALLFARQKFLETGDKSTLFGFYQNALEKGEINPKSPYKEDFDKEMSLIMNGTKDMWQETYGNVYIPQNKNYALVNGDKEGKYTQYYDENYQKQMKNYYKIGGVDFSEYMDKDVELDNRQKCALYEITKPKLSNTEWAKMLNVPEFDGTMSLGQYKKLALHSIVLGDMTNRNYMAHIRLEDVADAINNTNDEDFLLNTKKKFSKTLNNRYSAHKYAIDELVNSAALECDRKGIFPKDNDVAYNNAVNKLYTAPTVDGTTINIRNVLCPDDNITDKGLPQQALELQNMSKAERFVRKGMERMGLSNVYTWIKDKFSDKPEVDEMFVDEMFKDLPENNKSNNNSEDMFEGENVPVKEMYTGQPKYRQWKDKDGCRVSEVQYRELPDFTKDIIVKPTKSYADEGKEVGSTSKSGLKAQMKSDQQKAQNSANKIDEMFLDEMFTTPNTQNTSQQSSDNSFAVAQKVAKLKRSR